MPFNTRVTWAELQYTSVSALSTGQAYSVTHLETATSTDAPSASVGAYVPQTHTRTILETATATDAHSSVNIPVVTLTGSWTMPSTRPTSVEIGARVADHTAMATAADLVTVTYPITAYRYNNAGTQTFDLVQTITKSKSGADSRILSLSATSQQFKFGADDQPNPAGQTITFTANLQNLAGPAVWTARRFNLAGTELTAAALTGTGNTRTLTVAAFGNDAAWCEVKASYGGYSDTITVVALEEGVNGYGSNLLSNSNFKNGRGGWAYYATGGGASANLGFGLATEFNETSWSLTNSGLLCLHEIGGRPANGVTFASMYPEKPSAWVPVAPGERFDVSVYYAALRCSGALYVAFEDANGTPISEVLVASIDAFAPPRYLYGSTLERYARAGGFVTAPSGAARAIPYIVKDATLAGSVPLDSWIFSTMWFFGRATATQQTNAPWSDGTLRHVNTMDLIDDAATSVIIGNAYTTDMSPSLATSDGVAVCPVPSFPYEVTVRCTASVSGNLTYQTFAGNPNPQLLTAAIYSGYAGPKYALTYETIASVTPATPVMSGSASPTATFDVPANTPAFSVSLSVSRNNWTGSDWGPARFDNPRLAVEIIKK